MEPLLSVSGLSKSSFGVEVLHGVGFTLQPGEMMGLVGENGSGKPTTITILGGVLMADAGEIRPGGNAYEPRGANVAQATGISFMHQRMTLIANLAIGAK